MKKIERSFKILIIGLLAVFSVIMSCQRSMNGLAPENNSKVKFVFDFSQNRSANVAQSLQPAGFIKRIIVDVTASDMDKISKSITVSGNQVTSTLTVPQGSGRKFHFQALDQNTNLWYIGDTTAALNSADVSFSITLRPNYTEKIYKTDDGSPEGTYWFSSPDTLILNYFHSNDNVNKLSHIRLYIATDNGQNGNYRLVVLDTLGNSIWASTPVNYLGDGQWVDWTIADDVRLPGDFLVGIQHTGNNGYPEIGVDTHAALNSVAYILSSGQFLSFPYGTWMIRAVVMTPQGTRKTLSAGPPVFPAKIAGELRQK